MDYDRIWAPWRLSYIQGAAQSPAAVLPASPPPDLHAECFLCQDGAGETIALGWSSPAAIAALHCSTVTRTTTGILLVAPRRHVARLDQLETGEQLELFQTLARMTALLEKVLGAEGFNVGLNLGRVAGAGLPGHLHWHIVPRWAGDTNFMPVLAGTRVIPQALEALWEALREALGQ